MFMFPNFLLEKYIECSKLFRRFFSAEGMVAAFKTLGSLRSSYCDAEDNVELKMNLYFTNESRDTRKSFTLFITVKAITKLNLEHRNKFEIEF